MKTSAQLSRRNFLKRASLAGGLLILPSGFLRGANAPSNRVNIACVGVGGMGGSDLHNLRRQPGVTIVGICDVHSGNLSNAKRSCPHAQTFADYRKMFDKLDRDIDAVSAGTPDHTHFTISLDAVRRGKHIHVQKPMCRTVDQVRRLMAAATEHKVVSQMGNQGHSSHHIRLAKEWY
ncbi:MAG: Gfo/Idh/MocA family oxidoreductase, partial [Puniceicoccales bacterium]|nr:Gfo/Idh/MocA family oxidoreductase [Puniceicoccales bacterium]